MKRKKAWIGFLYILPSLLGIILLYLYPFVLSVRYSFTKGVFDDSFVWFDNYINVLDSESFWLAMKNTLLFYIIAFPLIFLLSLIFAVFITNAIKRLSIFKTILAIPLVIPTASLILFIKILFEQGGILNTTLKTDFNFLESSYAFAILIVIFLFKYTGYNTILYVSSMIEIDPVLYDEASICGASKLQEFKYITLPLIRPTSFLVFAFTMINSFHIYREAYYLGGEYPHESIYFIQHFLRNNYNSLSYQRLSSASVIMFIGIIILLLVFFFFQRRTEI